MNTAQSVVEAEIILAQMSEYPNEILLVIGEEELDTVIRELDSLAERLTTVQSVPDRLQLIYAILHLVENRQELNKLLRGTEERKRFIDPSDQLTTSELNTYIQERVPQIRNAVIKCHTQLEAALQKKAASEYKRKQGTDHDSSTH